MKRMAALLLCAALVMGAAHKAPHKRSKHVGKQVLPIALVLNGTKLAVNPPPVFYKDHLLVPIRRILSALGLGFDKVGRYVHTYAAAKTVTLAVGSTRATVNDQIVQLDAAPVEIKNVLYAPLRFFTQTLGAQAVFNRQTNSVEIISTLVGRSGNGMVATDGGVRQTGTVTAIDLDSSPPTLTLTYNASVRTMKIRSDVAVIVQDVNSGTSNAGEVEQVHTGDYAEIRLDKNGEIKQIIDAYGSRSGTVAAVGAGQVVLDDGHVITPTRATTISLNGSNAGIEQIAVGDQLMVRYNIDSSEPREIIATRKSLGSPAASGGVSIESITVSPQRPLRQGDTLTVTMRATPGGFAGYDIGPYVRNLTLSEGPAGQYTGSYVIPRGVNFAGAPVFGHLNSHGADAPPAVSETTVSVATEPPSIIDFAPDNGSTVNNSRPSIYATFSSSTVAVNPSSARLQVNGHDLTSSSTRTPRFIQYTPGIDYPAGPMRVTVSVADAAGNVATKSWTFFIRR
jgi:Copper amine oxidase N-terminal domain